MVRVTRFLCPSDDLLAPFCLIQRGYISLTQSPTYVRSSLVGRTDGSRPAWKSLYEERLECDYPERKMEDVDEAIQMIGTTR